MKFEIVLIALIFCVIVSVLNLFRAVCGFPDCSGDDVLCAIYYDEFIKGDDDVNCLN